MGPDQSGDASAMPFTAKQVLAHYLETGRHGSALYAGSAKPDGIPLFAASPNFNPFGMEGFSWRKLH